MNEMMMPVSSKIPFKSRGPFTRMSTSRSKKRTLEEASPAPAPTAPLKQKVLAISTRSVNARNRHLLEDLRALMPHAKKDR